MEESAKISSSNEGMTLKLAIDAPRLSGVKAGVALLVADIWEMLLGLNSVGRDNN
jgi:hypothetical protein